MMTPKKSAHWLRWIDNDTLLKFTPEIVMLVRRSSEEQVVDVDGKQQPVLWKPEGRRVRLDLLTPKVNDHIGQVPLPMGARLWVTVEGLNKQAYWVL